MNLQFLKTSLFWLFLSLIFVKCGSVEWKTATVPSGEFSIQFPGDYKDTAYIEGLLEQKVFFESDDKYKYYAIIYRDMPSGRLLPNLKLDMCIGIPAVTKIDMELNAIKVKGTLRNDSLVVDMNGYKV